MNSTFAPRFVGGFTLVELMVTIAVLAILLAIAIPSFNGLLSAGRLTSTSNELVAALQMARAESIRRNKRAIVCGSSDGADCAASSSWSGWLVFVDADGNGAPAAGEIIQRGEVRDPVTLLSSSSVTNSKVAFRSDGFARKDGTSELLSGKFRTCIATSTPTNNMIDIELISGSRVLSTKGNGGGACAAP